MNKRMKLTLGIFVLVVHLSISLAAYGQVEPNTSQLRQALKQVLENANSNQLVQYYISYLNDPNGRVQWVGAVGLYRINNPKATKELSNFLKTKNGM